MKKDLQKLIDYLDLYRISFDIGEIILISEKEDQKMILEIARIKDKYGLKRKT